MHARLIEALYLGGSPFLERDPFVSNEHTADRASFDPAMTSNMPHERPCAIAALRQPGVFCTDGRAQAHHADRPYAHDNADNSQNFAAGAQACSV